LPEVFDAWIMIRSQDLRTRMIAFGSPTANRIFSRLTSSREYVGRLVEAPQASQRILGDPRLSERYAKIVRAFYGRVQFELD
jgi:hypothetical protein